MPRMKDIVPDSRKGFTMIAVCATCGYEVFVMGSGGMLDVSCRACKTPVTDIKRLADTFWTYFDEAYLDLNQRELLGRFMAECTTLGESRLPCDSSTAARRARIGTLKEAILTRMQ